MTGKKFAFFLVFLIAINCFCPIRAEEAKSKMSRVFMIKTANRLKGLEKLFKALDIPKLAGKAVVIKASFNSDDPFPAATHLNTLEFVIKKLKLAKPKSITIAERSGMGDTEEVLKNRGVLSLAKKYGVKVIDLDKIPESGWVEIKEKGSYWKSGFLAARVFLDADYVINLPCLKTHRFGGDFTMSLKNNVGSIAKWRPGGSHNYMVELHSSPNQRLMIAEINRYIPNHLIIMDGMEGFATMGPETGRLIKPGLLLASEDRVAIDAVGVAVLRIYGTTPRVSGGRVFDLEQIRHAAELGVGRADAELVPLDAQSEEMAGRIRAELNKK